MPRNANHLIRRALDNTEESWCDLRSEVQDAVTEVPERFLIAKEKIKDICDFGAAKVALSKAKSLRDYAKAQWDDEDFREWIDNTSLFLQTPKPCKTCGHNGGSSDPIDNAMNDDESFDEFEKANPTFKWPAWPFDVKKPAARKRKAVKKR